MDTLIIHFWSLLVALPLVPELLFISMLRNWLVTLSKEGGDPTFMYTIQVHIRAFRTQVLRYYTCLHMRRLLRVAYKSICHAI